MFHFNLFAIPLLISALLILGIGIYTFRKKPASESRRALSYFCLSIFVWLFGYSGMYLSPDPDNALLWARIGFVGVAFIPFTNLYFNLTLLQLKNDTNKFLLRILFTVGGGLSYLAQTPLIYKRVESFLWGYYPQAGPLYPYFVGCFICVWLYGLYLLHWKMKEKKEQKDFFAYTKIKYVFIAWLGAMLGFIDFIPKFDIPIYPFGYLAAVYWTSVSAMAVLNYRTKPNIQSKTRKILIGCYFIGVLVLISIFCLLLSRLVSIQIDPKIVLICALVMGGITTIILKFVYQKTKNFIDRNLFPEYFDRKEIFKKLGNSLVNTKDTNQFNDLVLENIHLLFRTVQSSLFVADAFSKSYVMVAATEWGLPVTSEPNAIMKKHPLTQYLSRHPFLYEPKNQTKSKIISGLKFSLSPEPDLETVLCISIKIDDQLKGFFALGDKESGLPYSQKDIEDLCWLANLTGAAAKTQDLSSAKEELKKLVDTRTTELKTVQEELIKKERLAAIGTLASEVSHELRNPLDVLSSAASVLEGLLEKIKNEKGMKKLETIKKQIISMNRIITNMLDYARTRDLILEKYSINKVIWEAIALTEIFPSIKVHWNLSKSIPETMIDIQEMRQAMINLVTNACESMPNGGELTLSTELIRSKTIEIRISDTGCGIAPEHLDRIFEPFRSTKVRGNGLGMAVIKKVIDRHKGSITVESILGKGTTFVIKHPLYLNKAESYEKHEQENQKNKNISR